ncbi:prepilin-type N-terminal cleavage/methylation domain-containing protein [Limisphaera sp. VF-2]|jgi:prepilin-type N-terminal cleavage/methylation domain-containing protein/prepilin-type processing-associated H-X9-DG protein|uniref:prepilin-type N-terminal cleavage/methylation domain-containing protein n=1 Tax=Limisphaera sp. VF-2 TaxID=3400418 RepID=UPI00175F6E77
MGTASTGVPKFRCGISRPRSDSDVCQHEEGRDRAVFRTGSKGPTTLRPVPKCSPGPELDKIPGRVPVGGSHGAISSREPDLRPLYPPRDLRRSVSRKPVAADPGGPGWSTRPQRPPPASAGFSLVELLVVMVILGILAGILLPALARSRQLGKRTQCLSQLRQLAVAAQMYTDTYAGFFPPAYSYEVREGLPCAVAWDLTTVMSDPPRVVPGTLWDGQGNPQIQQCPEYRGPANWAVDPYTGYNYNTSYLGHGQFESVPEPARLAAVKQPAATAMFGDGQYAGGANKFMRAPWPNPGDAEFRGRWAGTQGYRHANRSNTAFVDGHVESLQRRFIENQDGALMVAPGTGFLSPDNSLYDLE